MTDIRTSRRFPVHLPLKVLGGPNVPVGTTANISAAGVYLWIDGGLEIGTSIDFEVTIPHETIGGDTDGHLNCHGRVLRCDADQKLGRTGVACVIERYEFLRAAEARGE